MFVDLSFCSVNIFWVEKASVRLFKGAVWVVSDLAVQHHVDWDAIFANHYELGPMRIAYFLKAQEMLLEQAGAFRGHEVAE